MKPLLQRYWIHFADDALVRSLGLNQDVDVTTLEANHVRANGGVVTWRGIWFPFIQTS